MCNIKIKKIIKFIIVSMIICGMILPSYASLAASDGSAFVTRPEYENALADFDSRLTTFEAGINTKIDSQVSSYLDRNGIWSINEQSLINNKYKLGGLAEEGWTLISNWEKKPDIAWPERVICNSLGKTGLAFIYFTIDAKKTKVAAGGGNINMYSNYDRTSYITGASVTPSKYYSALGTCRFECRYEFQQKDSTNTYVGGTVSIIDPIQYQFLPQGIGISEWATDVSKNLVYDEVWAYKYQKSLIMMFVTKDNSLWTRFAYDYTPGQGGTEIYMKQSVSFPENINGAADDAGTNGFWPVYNSVDSINIY